MINKKIKSDLNNLLDLNVLITTYEEIAAMRMRNIKNTVLANRNFLSDLNNIYGYVKTNYNVDLLKINLKRKLHIGKKTKGSVYVLLSSNTGLYGDIVKQTFDLFEVDIKDKKPDIVIVGKIGKEIYDEKYPNTDYKYFELTDGVVNAELASDIVAYCLQYDNITVYHGLFSSILSQSPIADKVTGEEMHKTSDKNATNNSKAPVKVSAEDIFEPSLDEIIQFFDKQILSSLFEQTLYESSLSKFAARMLNLDSASSRIANSLKRTNFIIQKYSHRSANKSQQDLQISLNLVQGDIV